MKVPVQIRKQIPVKCQYCDKQFKNCYSAGAHKPHCLGRGHIPTPLGSTGWAKNRTSFSDDRIRAKIKSDKVFIRNSKASRGYVKHIALKEDLLKNICSECNNQGYWNDKTLILQIDHINGIRDDHRLENLRMLCPNCHSQTETYCGRSKKTGRISDEKIIKALHSSISISDCIGKLRGRHAHRVQVLMIQNGITFPEQVKKSKRKYGDRKAYSKHTKTKTKTIDGQRLEKLFQSAIDFSKFGWCQKASKIINMTPQAISRFMKRACPKFYEEICFHRKSK